MKNARVLLLEDDPLWVETVRDVLGAEIGCLRSAASLEEAETLLNTCFFNVVIVDISLSFGDPKDSQGMKFLETIASKELLATVISPIVLSAYGDMSRQRRAFRDFDIVDFLEKSPFRPEELRAAVRTALKETNRLASPSVELESNRPISTLWESMEWARREEDTELRYELVDLLQRLFPGATELFVQPMRAGQSGAGVVQVEPLYGASRGAPVIVKFGKHKKIAAERQNYDEYIERFVGNHASTRLRHIDGRIMGAISYSIVGSALGEMKPLADYYLTASLADIRQAVDNLFMFTCRPWYENREQPRRTRDLVELYKTGLHMHNWQEIWDGMAQAYSAIDADQLLFPGVPGTFSNPKRWLEARHYHFYHAAWLATTHGDFNEYNIFVSQANHTWLIDFYRTGPGHILRDIIELECTIKFNLTKTNSLAEHHAFEQLLLSQTRLDVPVAVPDAFPHAKAVAVINHLREVSSDFTGPASDMTEYYVALLLHTLNLLRLEFVHSEDPLSRSRILLSASMLATKLASAGSPA